MARIVSRATSGVEPQRYGIGPVTAALTALQRADLKWDDLASVELNEAFAAQSLACLCGAGPISIPLVVNPLGGAIAIGHPLGCSGARILTTLVHHLAAHRGPVRAWPRCASASARASRSSSRTSADRPAPPPPRPFGRQKSIWDRWRPSPHEVGKAGQVEGLMFWLRQKKFVGSYWSFSATSRL